MRFELTSGEWGFSYDLKETGPGRNEGEPRPEERQQRAQRSRDVGQGEVRFLVNSLAT